MTMWGIYSTTDGYILQASPLLHLHKFSCASSAAETIADTSLSLDHEELIMLL